MGDLDYAIGGTNNLVEFKTAARVPITSLKAHFLPVQLGSGNPSQSNVREIRGWNSVDFNHGQINLIPKNIEFLSKKLKPYTNTGDDIIALASVYNAFYFPVPSGEIYFHCTNRVATYCSFCNEIPDVGVHVYNTVTMTNRSDYYWDNSVGYKYMVVFGMGNYETAVEAVNYSKLSISVGAYDNDATKPSCVSQTIQFPVLGKNKLDKTASLQKYRINIQGEITAATDYCLSDYIPVVAGKNYYLSNTSGMASNACTWFFDKNKEPISRASSITPMTAPTNAAYVRCSYFRANEDTVQLELGDAATTYESYNANNIVYGGYIDPVKGELVAEYAKLVINENTPLALAYNSKQENSTRVYTLTTYTLPNVLQDRDYDCYVDKATQGASFDSDNIRWFRQGNAEFNVYIPTSLTGITTEDDDSTIYDKAHAYLQTSPITYVFRMQTPITYPLNSEQLSTLIGANSVWTNTNDVTDVSYAVHDSAEMRMAKQRIAANEPHLETKSSAIVSFKTDLKAPIKQIKCEFTPVQNFNGYEKPWPAGGGKNLFNLNVPEVNPSDTTTTNTTPRIFTPNTYCVGMSWSNWWQPNQVTNYSINSTTLTVENNNVYGVGFAFVLTANQQYTISASSANGGINCTFYDINGEPIDVSSTNVLNSSFTVPVNCAITVLTFFSRTQNTAATFTNIQLEKGSTATSYYPYENVCAITGTTNAEVYKNGKNQIDENYLANANNYVNQGAYGYVYTNDVKLVPNTRYRFVWYDYDNTALSELGSSSINLYVTGANEYIINNSDYRQYSSGFLTPNTGVVRFGIYAPSTLVKQDVLNAIFGHGKLLLQIGTSDETYEPYCGTKIPIEFPVTKNLFPSYNGASSSISITAGTQFTVSAKAVSNPYFRATYSDGTDTGIVWMTSSTFPGVYVKTFTPEKDIVSMFIFLSLGVEECQVELGSKVTAYESYRTTYGGYIDPVKGVFVKTHGRIVVDGVNVKVNYEYTKADSNRFGGGYVYCDPVGTFYSNSRKNVVCDILPVNPLGYTDPGDIDWLSVPYAGKLYVVFYIGRISEHPEITTKQQKIDFTNAWLQEHPATIVYELQTPVEYKITPTIIKTLQQHNNVWSDLNGNTTVTYWTH